MATWDLNGHKSSPRASPPTVRPPVRPSDRPTGRISKIVTFMNMVITGVENGSPDMIPVAFERKFDELLNEIPPGIYRHHIIDFFQYWGWED